MSVIKNRLTRELKRTWVNFWLKRRHEGLIICDGVSVFRTKFGRYNMLCDRCSVTNSTFGDYSYVGTETRVSNATIGKFCSIGPNVLISLGIHPSRDFVSTHPVFYSTTFRCQRRFAAKQGFVEHGPVQIGHDVWIGAGAIISDNINIGTGAIVAAGAVVTKHVDPYAIVGGSPARLIRKRFTDDQIQQLLGSNWWTWDDNILSQHHVAFHDFDSFLDILAKQKNRTREPNL